MDLLPYLARSWRLEPQQSDALEMEIARGSMRHPTTGQPLRTFDSVDSRIKQRDPRDAPGPVRRCRVLFAVTLGGVRIEPGQVVEISAAEAFNGMLQGLVTPID